MQKLGRVFISFDIDGTLIAFGGASKNHPLSVCQAFSELFFPIESPEVFLKHPIDGMTDYVIIKEILEKMEQDTSDETIEMVKEKIENIFIGYPMSIPDILPGVTKLLEELSQIPNVTIGIASGNFPRIGWKKMELTNLIEYFPSKICGMGLHSSRKNALLEAKEVAERIVGAEFSKCIHIGDTIADHKAAKDAGFIPVIVKTGRHKEFDINDGSLIIENFDMGLDTLIEYIQQ